MILMTGNLKKISTRTLWAVTILIAVFTYVNTSQIAPNDFWWHMAIGRDILTTRTIPAVDVYTHTMLGALYPSYNMFWLMDVWLFGLYTLGGLELVLFIHSLLITGTYLIILILCYRNSRRWGVTSICTFFAIVTGIYAWNVRPQAISFLIGSMFMYAIYAYRQRPNPVWMAVFPIGMLVWVNSHGSFPIGLMLIGIWLLDEIWQIYRSDDKWSFKPLYAPGFTLVLTSAICLANPRGVGLVSYIRTMVTNTAVQSSVPEWAAPSFSSPIGPIFFTAILIMAVVLAISPRRPTFFQIVMFLAFTILGLSTTRGVIWFGLAVAPILAYHLSAILENQKKDQIGAETKKKSLRINVGFLVILLLIAFLSLPWFRNLLPMPTGRQNLVTESTPIEGANFLVDQSPPEPIFNDMGYGSYLIWAAQPKYKVFVDPRIELFPQNVWMDYHMISNAVPGWDQILDEYNVQSLMLDTKYQAPLIESLADSSNWYSIYHDEAAQIFVRVD